MKRLTAAQQATLTALQALGLGEEDTFRPLDIFPARDNVDNGRRRTLRSLLAHGCLQEEPSGTYRIVAGAYRHLVQRVGHARRNTHGAARSGPSHGEESSRDGDERL